ncbi:MAG: hypothetical protein II695_01300 [Oscillospiraceae bacterium]|nr:hypothetical protein [Oscillospiraceae bacterium]
MFSFLKLFRKDTGVCFPDRRSAENAAGFGFSMHLPYELSKRYTPAYTVLDGNIIEIRYHSDDGDEIIVHKGRGETDVSGDRKRYRKIFTWDCELGTVIFKGMGRNKKSGLHLAMWSHDGASYSVRSTRALDRCDLRRIIIGIAVEEELTA